MKEKAGIMDFFLKHKVKMIFLVIALIIGMPVLINESYKIGKGYLTLWDANDVLAYYGTVLSFLGSLTLGIVAIWQNHKMQKINEQLQKLEIAQYVSMVSVTELCMAKRREDDKNMVNARMHDLDIIDFTMEKFQSDSYYHIDVCIENHSEYPIVQMKLHVGDRNDCSGQLYGIQNLIDHATYIASNSKNNYRFVIPSIIFDSTEQSEMKICINFVNIFNAETPANLTISEFEHVSNAKYQYRLLKFTDVISMS